jgi:hypothetical protein
MNALAKNFIQEQKRFSLKNVTMEKEIKTHDYADKRGIHPEVEGDCFRTWPFCTFFHSM